GVVEAGADLRALRRRAVARAAAPHPRLRGLQREAAEHHRSAIAFSVATALLRCLLTNAARSRAAPHMLSSISPRASAGSSPSQAGSMRPRAMPSFTTTYLPENRSPSGMTAASVPLSPKRPDSQLNVSGAGG